MITQMKKYTFLVFHRDYDAFLSRLRDLGVVDITLKSAGDIENDETLQAALQHEDELRRLIKQGAPDQLISEQSNIQQRIADAQKEAAKAAVWGEFDPARVKALKEAGYNLRFFSSPDLCPGVGLLEHLVSLFLVFQRTSVLFSIVTVISLHSPNNVGRLPFLHTLSNIYCL